MNHTIEPSGWGRAPLGARVFGDGVHFAVFSAHADRIQLCLFDADDREVQRLNLPERQGDVWQGFVPGLAPGTRYGYRAHGPFAPDAGHRFNPRKLVLDPYARQLSGSVVENPALYDTNSRDSAAFMPKAIVLAEDPHAARPSPERPRHPEAMGIVYEAHVKGLTASHPDVPPPLRGTYEALADRGIIDHLARMGVTAIELLPIHAFVNDGFLLRRGLTNYWGYNTLAFFAPEPRYLGPNGINGLKASIARLHEAGIEVILDVVYNHTAEGGARGPTFSFRGLDNASYYRRVPQDASVYINDTGCGNTVDLTHPMVLRMVIDSLRYWVEAYGIDGFRFDLAPVLGRELHGFDPKSGFFDALMQDPLLRDVKLIAEPWDIGPGGYQLGAFPAGFMEWNDRFRDDVRRFWKGDAGMLPSVAGKLMGSADIFDRAGRRPWASVNFVTAHDGFTLSDLVSYERKHNHANGERNRDGHGANFSSNGGVEGPTDDAEILARRALRRRNLLATVLLSQGVPMFLAGDEIGSSQDGNNNAYCQDNQIGWVDWENADIEFLEFVRRVIALRREHPALRQPWFLHADRRKSDGAPDVEWIGFEDAGLDWRNPRFNRVALRLRESASAPASFQGDDDILIAINGGSDPGRLDLPKLRRGMAWWRDLSTAGPDTGPEAVSGGILDIPSQCIEVYTKRPLSVSDVDAIALPEGGAVS